MPAIPVIASIGGAVASAAPAIAGVAGAVSAVQGISQQKKAAEAAQNQANLASGMGVNQAQQQQDAMMMAYFNSNPAFAAEYNRHMASSNGTDRRTQAQWLADGLRNNPVQMQEFQAFSAQNAGNVIPGSAMGPGGTIDVNTLQQQAQAVARQNAANSAALEREFNPGAQELRAGSLEALLAALNPATQQTLMNLATGGAPALSPLGAAPGVGADNAALLSQIRSQAGEPLTNNGFDSALTRQAVEAAAQDLALGGQLPQDVRNLVARTALARSAAVTGGGLGLGRDMTARDLGLTSLDLRRQRLAQAAALGQQEAGLEAANAAMRAQAEQYGRQNLFQSQAALDAQDARALQAYSTQAQLQAQRDALASNNYFNQANLLQNIASGDFARAMSAAQLGQNIAAPQSGLSPGSVADVAVGNVNIANNAQQNANAVRAASGQQQAQFGSQLLGTALPGAIDFFKGVFTPKVPTLAPTTVTTGGSGIPSIPGWSPSTY